VLFLCGLGMLLPVFLLHEFTRLGIAIDKHKSFLFCGWTKPVWIHIGNRQNGRRFFTADWGSYKEFYKGTDHKQPQRDFENTIRSFRFTE
jgi:hypothetical protein